MKINIGEQLLALVITVIGVFIALALDNFVAQKNERTRFQKLINISFIECQSHINQLNSFVVGIQQNIEPFVTNPPGSFFEKNMPSFLLSIDNVLNNENLVEYASPNSISILLQNIKHARIYQNYLTDWKSLGTIENVKIGLKSIVGYYSMVSYSLFTISNGIEDTYSVEKYNRLVEHMSNRSNHNSLLKKLNRDEIKKIIG